MFKIRFELFLKTVLGYAVILVALLSISFLLGKLANAYIILASYSSTRWVFPLTYHAKTDKGCIMFTIACFSIAIIISLPINLSIIASVLVGMAILGFFWAFKDYFAII